MYEAVMDGLGTVDQNFASLTKPSTGLDILGRMYAIFTQGRQFVWHPVCFIALQANYKTESPLKGKNLLPAGANSFILE